MGENSFQSLQEFSDLAGKVNQSQSGLCRREFLSSHTDVDVKVLKMCF